MEIVSLRSKPFSYHFSQKSLNSPTYFNLSTYLKEQHWRQSALAFLADFNESNFQFDLAAAQQLEFKDLLAQLVARFCPERMPLTFCIQDSNWPVVLQQAADAFHREEGLQKKDHPIWILKPALLNNGQHIKIFQCLSQLEEHFMSSNRLGGNHVLQQYLSHPHLLKGPVLGHKYSLRLFVVLTNYAGAYLFPKGYFNVALKPYLGDDFSSLSWHLTNEHLKEEVLNVVQIPTQQIALFKPFYTQIKTILTEVIGGLHQLHPKAFLCDKKRHLAIFGFDFMVDANEKVWLLEANHGPCFPTTSDHPLYSSLYYEFWQAFILSFVLPIAKKQPLKTIVYHLFESIST
jgi:hypothetical protein